MEHTERADWLEWYGRQLVPVLAGLRVAGVPR